MSFPGSESEEWQGQYAVDPETTDLIKHYLKTGEPLPAIQANGDQSEPLPGNNLDWGPSDEDKRHGVPGVREAKNSLRRSRISRQS
jgi:hypothetical protein